MTIKRQWPLPTRHVGQGTENGIHSMGDGAVGFHQLNRLSEAKTVSYGTSGDVSGDKSRVVGYAGYLLR